MRTADNKIIRALHTDASIRQFDQLLKIAYGDSGATTGEKITAGKNARAAMLAFMQTPAEVSKDALKAKIAAFELTKGSLPDTLSQITGGVFNEMADYDNQYSLAFRSVPPEPGHNWFEILTVTNGVTWQKVPTGDQVKISKFSGAVSRVTLDRFGAALAWDDDYVRFSGYVGRLIQMAEEVRTSYYLNKAANYYALLGAAATAATYVTYQAGANTLEKDVNTLNAIGLALVNAAKGKGYQVGEILLYMKPEMLGRITNALRTNLNPLTTTNTVVYNFRPMVTNIVATGWPTTTTDVVAVVAGRKIMSCQIGADMEQLSDSEILSREYVSSFWSYYGGAVGYTGQVKGGQFA